MWRTLIIHCLVPNCGIPDFPLAKFGLGDDDAGYEIWFRNTHNAGMARHLMHHTLKAWDDLLPEFEGIAYPQAKEREMLNCVEIFLPLGSALSPKFDHQNYYGRFTSELGGDPILCPAKPNQFSVVVEKIMVGATEEMRKLADEAQTRRRGQRGKSLQPLRVSSCRGTPSEESCAGRNRHKFEIDNTQLV